MEYAYEKGAYKQHQTSDDFALNNTILLKCVGDKMFGK